MPSHTLTVLDITGIQEYIFGSNRLREHVAASYLVEQATDAWVHAALPSETAVAEIVYRGGGNVVILFQSSEKLSARHHAHATVRQLSRTLLERAPGLDIVAAHQEFDWNTDAIGGPNGIYAQLLRALERRKQQRRSTVALPGQSVTLVCRSTGLPAVDLDPEEPTRPISAEVAAKVDRKVRNEADERLHTFLHEAGVAESDIAHYALSRDFDELGRAKGESSYIAVVHADANSMGQRFTKLVNLYDQPNEGNSECLQKLSGLSLSLETAGKTALQATVRQMMAAFKEPHFKSFVETLTYARTPQGQPDKPYLPFRPLIYGGDDVTFVCDGRLGLTMAATYLQEFAKAASMLDDGEPAFACAGVAIVKVHYPFARAYTLCEELCKSAKQLVRTTLPNGEGTGLDWYFATTGITGDLDALRERAYTTPKGPLDMRPVLVDAPGWRTWSGFTQVIETLLYAPSWTERRNKVIALREALRAGDAATRQFRAMYGMERLTLPQLTTPDTQHQQTGWIGDRCAYFDAIEAMDFYLPLSLSHADVIAQVQL